MRPVPVPMAPLPGHGYVPPLRRGYPPTGQRPASMTLLYIWILLFGFVGTQLAWTLRPFFGRPGEEFALFRSIEGNFYAEIQANATAIQRARNAINEFAESGADLAALSVLLRQIRTLVRTSAAT